MASLYWLMFTLYKTCVLSQDIPFQTVRWLWYWELNWSSHPVQLCHNVSLIEIPHMLSSAFQQDLWSKARKPSVVTWTI